MKNVYILVYHNARLSSILDAYTMFSGVNGFLEAAGRSPEFNIHFAGLHKQVRFHDAIFSVHLETLLHDIDKADIIIIPAITDNYEATLHKSKELVPWIADQYRKGAEIASLCSGAFLLASTGLLKGKECSTHWATAGLFRELFPDVDLVDGRVVTEQDGLYSSGGATSYWNLLLHLVEKYTSREFAIIASKVFALEIDRKTQSPFVIFNGQKRHEDESVKQAQEFIEQNVAEKISVEDLSVRFSIGRRHFERRFKKATNNTPIEYIQRVKIEAAKKKLETSGLNVNEVMYEVGYFDIKTFRAVFKKLTGLSPTDYRNKYNKEAAVGSL